MKSLKLISTTALVSLLFVGQAQAVVNGTHKGSLFVKQSGVNFLNIAQVAGNSASVTQTGNSNSAGVSQGLFNGVTSNANSAAITQVGNNNYGTIGQDASRNNKASISVTGDNNVSQIGQAKGSYNNYAKISSYGDSNFANITQFGSSNTAYITQNKGKFYGIDVAGSNTADIFQSGVSNKGYITQNGALNTATIKQLNNGNTATITQNGAFNDVSITQYGGKSYSITQTGNFIPPVTIVQK